MSVAAFIACQRREHQVPHVVACRALGVSPSWFYKWKDRGPTGRDLRRVELAEKIAKSHAGSGGTYGSPRVCDELRDAGVRVSVNTVARIMSEEGIAGRVRLRRHGLTRPGTRATPTDKVRRNFTSVAPDVLWCGDLTEITTGEGKVYLATTIDLFSRRALGYAFGVRHDAALAVAALRQAAVRRGGNVDGVIFHSDRGSEYTAGDFQNLCARLGVTQSMARVGSALDNACAESFNSIVKVEFVHRNTFPTRHDAITRISAWINGFYNPRRRHSANNGMAPIAFEEHMVAARRAAIT